MGAEPQVYLAVGKQAHQAWVLVPMHLSKRASDQDFAIGLEGCFSEKNVAPPEEKSISVLNVVSSVPSGFIRIRYRRAVPLKVVNSPMMSILPSG